ncbi:MAG TPA: hypothetical protein VNO30_14295 [Kofleriaceae bacterium]|nr:hypothetical protein [Kofleriaceae bacterium]
MSQTRESYDAVAEAYADKFEGELEDKHLDRALLDTFAELCRGAGPVYDLGCGPGTSRATWPGAAPSRAGWTCPRRWCGSPGRRAPGTTSSPAR